MIAIALACRPTLLIADEPTTALDVTIQAQILNLMKHMQERFGTSIILITHDLGVVAGMCDRVAVMKDGEIVESGTTEEIFENPKHPYTLKLLHALPRLNEKKKPKRAPLILPGTDSSKPLLDVRSLKQYFDLGKGNVLKAVDNISFHIKPGETLGLVGESGSGKSTTGRAVLRLNEPTGGEVLYQGIPVNRLSQGEMKVMRRHMQMIFQDPYASLNPRFKVLDIIGQALDIHKLARNSKDARKRESKSCWIWWGLSHHMLCAIRMNFPVGSGSGSELRVHLRWNQNSSSVMNRCLHLMYPSNLRSLHC